MSDNSEPVAGIIKTLVICTCIVIVAGLTVIGLAAIFGKGC